MTEFLIIAFVATYALGILTAMLVSLTVTAIRRHRARRANDDANYRAGAILHRV